MKGKYIDNAAQKNVKHTCLQPKDSETRHPFSFFTFSISTRFLVQYTRSTQPPSMAPTPVSIPRAIFVEYAKRTVVAAGPEMARLLARGLSVNHTQGITLGIIVLYVAVIVLLWIISHVKYSLWPFKELPLPLFPCFRLSQPHRQYWLHDRC